MARTGKRLVDLSPKALDLNALVELEDAFGSLDTIDFTRLKVLRHVLWLDARRAQPEVTIEEVGARFDADSLYAKAVELLRRSGLVDPRVAPVAPTAPDGATSTGA